MEWMDAAGLLALVVERSQDNDLLETTVQAARNMSPLVAELPEEETRRHTKALIHGVINALTSGDEISDDAVLAAEGLGSDRASQGVPVAALLDGFQAGRTHLIRMLIAEGRSRGVPADVLLDSVTRIDEITTVLAHRMVHAHRVTELEQARTARESRVQVLRQLLHGEPAAGAGPLDPGGSYHCVVSDVSDPALAQQLEGVLTGGLCGLVDGRFVALVPRLPEVAADTPLLVASPPVRLAEIAALYGLCRRAHAAATGRTGLCELADLALVTATAAEPDLGRLLASGLLGGLSPGDAFHRELAETALAYLDHGGRIEPTASALHVHPNTVKYRIRRFQELTSRALTPRPGTAVSHTAHLWWALHTHLGST